MDNTESIRPLSGFITTSEGVTNYAESPLSFSWRSGITSQVRTSGVIVNQIENSVIEFTSQNHDITTVPGVSYDISIPSGLDILSMDGGSCGTLSPRAGGATWTLSYPAAAAGVIDWTHGDCSANITVRSLAPGDYEIRLEENSSGHFLPAASGRLSATDSPLEVTASFDDNEIYLGDSSLLRVRLTNNLPSTQIDNISLSNRVGDHIPHSLIDAEGELGGSSGPLAENSCGATPHLEADGSRLDVTGFSLAPGASCDLAWRVRVGSGAWDRININSNNLSDMMQVENGFGPSDLTYHVSGGPAIPLGHSITAPLDLRRSTEIWAEYSPRDYNSPIDDIAFTRIWFNLMHYSREGNGLQDIAFDVDLPAGLLVNENPEIWGNCDGFTLDTPILTDHLRVSGGHFNQYNIPDTPCAIGVTLRTAPLPESVPYRDFMTDFHADLPQATRRSFEAQDPHISGPAGRVSNVTPARIPFRLSKADASVTVSYHIDEDTPPGSARVRVAMKTNILTNENHWHGLNDIRLPINLPSGLALSAAPDPVFVESDGGTYDCYGARFTAPPGGNQIYMEGGTASPSTTCYMEFNVVARDGGNHTIEIPRGALISGENYTNHSAARATMTSPFMLATRIGFLKSAITEGGDTELKIEVINNLPSGSGADYHGEATALSYTIPSGLTPFGSAETNCPGASVSLTGNVLALHDGEFLSDTTCDFRIPVRVNNIGTYPVSLNAGSLQTIEGSTNALDAHGLLHVILPPSIGFNSVPITRVYENGFADIIISNPNAAAHNPDGLSGIGAKLYLGPGIRIENAQSDCRGLNYNTWIPEYFEIGNIRLAAGESCNARLHFSTSSAGMPDGVFSFPVSDQVVFFDDPISPEQPFRIATAPLLHMTTPNGPASTGAPFRVNLELENPNPFAIGIENPGFNLDFPSTPGAMTVAGSSASASNCGGASLSASDAATAIALSGGSLPASGSCDVSFDMLAAAEGDYDFTPEDIHLEYGAESLSAFQMTIVAGTPEAQISGTRSVRVMADHAVDAIACAALPPASTGSRALPGACVEVTVTIRNALSSPVHGEDIVVTERIDENLALASSDQGSTDDLDIVSNGIEIGITDLAPGESRSFSYRAWLN